MTSGYRGFELTSEQVLSLPIDELGLAILRDFDIAGGWNFRNWMLEAKQSYEDSAWGALAEAWEWLISRGLVRRDYSQSAAEAVRVSRLGRKTLDEGLSVVRATERLGVNLHPRLERTVRRQWLMGEHELATFAAMKEVEVAVRQAAELSDSLVGVKLMRAAFGNGGPLHDPEMDGGEADSLRELFTGAIGLFKNPASHRPVDYTDLDEATEVILTADLLLRVLDRQIGRLALRTAASGD